MEEIKTYEVMYRLIANSNTLNNTPVDDPPINSQVGDPPINSNFGDPAANQHYNHFEHYTNSESHNHE